MVSTWSALTGDRLRAEDSVASGVATHRVVIVAFLQMCSMRFAETSRSMPSSVRSLLQSTKGRWRLWRRQSIVSLRPTLLKLFFANLDRAEASDEQCTEWARATAATIRTRLADQSQDRTGTSAPCQEGALKRPFEGSVCCTEFRSVSRVVYGKGISTKVCAPLSSSRITPPGLAAGSAGRRSRMPP